MMKFKSYYLFLLLFCIFFACSSESKQEADTSDKTTTATTTTKDAYRKISSADFAQQLATAKDPQLIDVRTPQEFNQGHLEQAVNLNYHGDFFIEELRKLDKNKPLFIYCQSGGRSGKACYKLKKMGFKEIYDMEGGYLAWQEAK